MKQFELRFLDRLDVVMSTRIYGGGDDLAALAEAERLSITHTIEVWQGLRKVARVKKANAALNSRDRICG
ncbi:MAG TPA: hypothetical protein VNX61_00970 [Rhizomicrobium sp.]|jgi:hypothetical protein|nr:hypothetical protein [Rhizomicrobium sp.]